MNPDAVIGFRADTETPPALPLWRRWTRRTVAIHPADLVEVGHWHPATSFADVEDIDWYARVAS